MIDPTRRNTQHSEHLSAQRSLQDWRDGSSPAVIAAHEQNATAMAAYNERRAAYDGAANQVIATTMAVEAVTAGAPNAETAPVAPTV